MGANRRRTLRSAACAALLCVAGTASLGVSSAAVSAKTGTVTGAIRFAGGPPRRSRPAEAGTVSVFTRAGTLVASQRVTAGHSFRFRLAPGRYELNSGSDLHPKLGCPPVPAQVRAGRTTHTDVGTGCSIP